jgi:all-trans-retinol dehydrogenase (NAD+)
LLEKPGFSDPVLEAQEVSDAIVMQVVSGRGGQLILPKEVNFLSTLRAWPSWLQTTIRNNIAPLLNFTEEEVAAYRA